MPGKARIDAAGALHHIIVRGTLSLRVRVGTMTRLKLVACYICYWAARELGVSQLTASQSEKRGEKIVKEKVLKMMG